ncbi:MAG: hypothetical protein C4532_02960 [Candidatus Abyssobacteria bacterium SURF_17]|jgi:hypothetical protein|uniref:Uncharacterized protein n=1 Tax=Candidatus Abyssobacteria bacterium SURF_17 TaxID=2093361 RepID=A0A419F727_9BACT|nr:MAG: hypothetical protein C4532_02960 [Candidatus Abyssubacteria bacterium SURF_17]
MEKHSLFVGVVRERPLQYALTKKIPYVAHPNGDIELKGIDVLPFSVSLRRNAFSKRAFRNRCTGDPMGPPALPTFSLPSDFSKHGHCEGVQRPKQSRSYRS